MWISKWRVTRCKLWVMSYYFCKGYKFLFTCELRVFTYCTSYELTLTCELLVTIYCKSYKVIFKYELRVIIYCTSYELILTCDIRVTIYCTSYEAVFIYELRVTIYCLSCDCHVDCVKFLYSISYLYLWTTLHKTKLATYSWTINFVNICSNDKLNVIKLWHSYWKVWLLSAIRVLLLSCDCNVDCVKFLYYISYSFLWTIPYKIKLASYSWAINFVNMCSNGKLNATKLWHCHWKAWLLNAIRALQLHRQIFIN